MERKYPPLEIVAPLMFAVVFVVMLIYSRFEPNVEDVDSQYVREHSGETGYVIVDARAESTYLGKSPRPGVPGGHIPGAVSFPMTQLAGRTDIVAALLAKEGITKDKTVIVYCSAGVLSGRFADQLVKRFNFSSSHIKNYRGSVLEWVKNPKNILLPPEHETDFAEDMHSQKFKGK